MLPRPHNATQNTEHAVNGLYYNSSDIWIFILTEAATMFKVNNKLDVMKI